MARTATRDRRHARQLAGPRTYQPLPLGLRCLSSLCGMCPIQPHRSPQGMARLACAALVLLLAACGGGGGDDAGDTTPAAAGDAAPSDSPTPAPGPETAPVTEQASCGIPDFAAAALAAVNQRRAAGATCGSRGSFAAAAPLRWSSQLAVASASHTSADGRSMTDRVNATGYSWASLGENIAAGYSGIDSVVEGWMRSEGHCANIMDPAFDEMALACAIGAAGSRYGQYWTQNLARKR
jgi:uncharacterized protein YkwD